VEEKKKTPVQHLKILYRNRSSHRCKNEEELLTFGRPPVGRDLQQDTLTSIASP